MSVIRSPADVTAAEPYERNSCSRMPSGSITSRNDAQLLGGGHMVYILYFT
jgi:hypothetical protein